MSRPVGGRFFEEFRVGERIEHELGRTITQADNIWFTMLTLNTNPSHFDAEYAKTTEFGKPLVNSCLTLSLVTGLSVSDISQNAVANLGWDGVKLPAPVFEGDTLRARTDIIEARESRSRPGVGILTVRTTGYNQRGETVIEFVRSVMVPRRDAAASSRSPVAAHRDE